MKHFELKLQSEDQSDCLIVFGWKKLEQSSGWKIYLLASFQKKIR